jgi:restriction system protein
MELSIFEKNRKRQEKELIKFKKRQENELIKLKKQREKEQGMQAKADTLWKKNYALNLKKQRQSAADELAQKAQSAIEQLQRTLVLSLDYDRKEIKSLYAAYSLPITKCCELTLASSGYPDTFPKDFDLDYNEDTKILIVEYQLPTLHHLPNIKEVRYIKSKDKIQEIYFSEKELVKLYDDLIYQIILRSLHELFDVDTGNKLDAIIFNGWVTAIDKAHGNETVGCIVSIQVSKDEFMAINLARVDAKACFKLLKGVGSSQLHSLTPIPPIMQIDKSDRRFVNSHAVVDAMDDATNLAAMSWEDFEHLIRELFEKEFKQYGGECNVTRASRDGGVDAIAFDPDPIRGGKIVIQAKRYTKTVGVSAVRDLYGTVLNEGANKGILVTTADYGPDSYEFAKGKPLTLLNGANLLNLLARHGHRAKIDLQAARVALALQE